MSKKETKDCHPRASEIGDLVVSAKEQSGQVTLSVRRPNTSYIAEAFRLDSFEEFAKWRLYRNAFELTKAFALFHAGIHLLGGMKNIKKNKASVFVIGEGERPTTSLLFAFRTKCRVASIDPALSADFVGSSKYMIKRYLGHRGTVEDKLPAPRTINGDVLLVFPSSHVSIKSTLKRFPATGRVSVLHMPCGCKNDAEMPSKKPVFDKIDNGVLGPTRRVIGWRL